MEYKIYDQLPEEAKALRITVFVDEQGFQEEFDEAVKHGWLPIFEGFKP